MRSASLFIRHIVRLLILVLVSVAAIVTPAPSHATTVAGASCTMVNGVDVCTDGSIGTQGTSCVTDTNTGVNICLNQSTGQQITSQVSALGKGFGSMTGQPVGKSNTGWLSKLTNWVAYAINAVFTAIVSVLKDLVTYVIASVLGLVVQAIASLPVPDFISKYSMGSLLGQTGPIAGFFMTQLQIPAALGLIGAGYGFRLLRKFLTLFQW